MHVGVSTGVSMGSVCEIGTTSFQLILGILKHVYQGTVLLKHLRKNVNVRIHFLSLLNY